MITIKVIM